MEQVIKYEAIYRPGPENHVSVTVVVHYPSHTQDVMCGGYKSMWVAQQMANNAINKHMKKQKENGINV